MESDQGLTKQGFRQQFLSWANLRSEESGRTFLMLAFYTTTSIGLAWLEFVATGLFINEYKSEGLPAIYIFSAIAGLVLGSLYSQLQRLLPLRWAIVLASILMALPLVLFRIGLDYATTPFQIQWLHGTIAGATIFLMRLWMEVIQALNDLNTSITANQLFNIREIRRTYPLISSGILIADVISGFSLPILTTQLGFEQKNVVVLSAVLLVIGAGILLYISQAYRQAFPDSRRRLTSDRETRYANRRLQGPMRRYIWLLFAFFVLAQALFLLIDFAFLGQLQDRYAGFSNPDEQITVFVSYFNGVLGLFELAVQWFISSRLIDRWGVFPTATLLPGAIGVFGAVAFAFSVSQPLSWWIVGIAAPVSGLFASLVLLKFIDELLHYTLLASVGPILFQALPDNVRSRLQASIKGIADPISTGMTASALLGMIVLGDRLGLGQLQRSCLLPIAIVLAGIWLVTIWLLNSRYVDLLVMSAERGQLSANVDLRELKRAVIEAMEQSETDAQKSSCIELISQFDPDNVGAVLAPALPRLSAPVQYKCLEEMLKNPKAEHLEDVKLLLNRKSTPPEVLAVALRYIWLTERSPDLRELQPYLLEEMDPIVRGTAASLMLKLGNPKQKAEATNTLRLMLTSKIEKERIMGCRALGEAQYMQALRIYIPKLLEDQSLRVRCALLEAIAATHLEEYYPSLLRGLHYKTTREAAMKALVRLENDALPMLTQLADDTYQSDIVRMHAWKAIGQMGSNEAIEVLISRLMTSWGANRRNLLRILLEIPKEAGIERVLDRLGRSGVERMLSQEMMFVGQICAALIDLTPNRVPGQEADLLRRALLNLQQDCEERLFLLMRFLYPIGAIKAAAFNLQSASRSNMARGLEILDNTIDIPNKRALLQLLDRNSALEKLQSLADLMSYEPMTPGDRLRHLVDLRHFLSDWSLACTFHLARQARWSLSVEQTMACLRHPRGFVREAVLMYVRMVSPRTLARLLPQLPNDPDPLVRWQLQEIRQTLPAPPPPPSPQGSH